MCRPRGSENTDFQDSGSRTLDMETFREIMSKNHSTSVRLNRTTSMTAEFKMVKRKTTFFKRSKIFLVRSGTSEEKWLQMCAVLSKSI